MEQVIDSLELQNMHDLYRAGGEKRLMAPHIVYTDPLCPYPDCGQQLQAIDFRLEAHGPVIHDPLVLAWWRDVGFAGQCPKCGGWIHFTIRGKRPISAEEAETLPKLPDEWDRQALIL